MAKGKNITSLKSYSKSKNLKSGKVKNTSGKNIKNFRIWVILLICLGLFTLAFVSNSSYFEIKSVEIEGNTRTSIDNLVKELDLIGNNIFFVDLGDIESCIMEDRWIKKAELSTVFPDKVRINVTERIPKILYDTENGKYFVLSKDLKVLEENKDKSNNNLPLITGRIIVGEENLKPGDRISLQDYSKDMEIEILSKLTSIDLIKEINFAGNKEILLDIEQGLEVIIGKPEKLGKKCYLLENIILKLEKSDKKLENYMHLDLRVPEYPVLKEK